MNAPIMEDNLNILKTKHGSLSKTEKPQCSDLCLLTNMSLWALSLNVISLGKSSALLSSSIRGALFKANQGRSLGGGGVKIATYSQSG